MSVTTATGLPRCSSAARQRLAAPLPPARHWGPPEIEAQPGSRCGSRTNGAPKLQALAEASHGGEKRVSAQRLIDLLTDNFGPITDKTNCSLALSVCHDALPSCLSQTSLGSSESKILPFSLLRSPRDHETQHRQHAPTTGKEVSNSTTVQCLRRCGGLQTC